MESWFETKVRYEKMNEGGKLKKVTEPYLVEAISVSEAEARITAEVTPLISGDFFVSVAKEQDIAEIFRDDRGDRWYKVTAGFITFDEKTAKEKRTNFYYMVQACDFETAYNNFIEGMKGSVSDFEIVAITETKIMDVFNYKPEA